jgi:hypothetical protein
LIAIFSSRSGAEVLWPGRQAISHFQHIPVHLVKSLVSDRLFQLDMAVMEELPLNPIFILNAEALSIYRELIPKNPMASFQTVDLSHYLS